MENSKKENLSTKRDYDKSPVIIEDFNPLFKILMVFVAAIWFFGTYVLSYGEHHSSSSMYWFAHFWGYTFIPMVGFYFYFKKSNRKVILTNNTLTYTEDNGILEIIHLNEITDMKQTFNDYYLKEQNVNPEHTIRIFLGRLISPIEYLILILNKFFFHLVKNRLSSYKLFDAILVMTQDGRIINILPTNTEDYESIKEYFLNKIDIDISNIPKLIKFDYKEETKRR